MNEPIMFLNRVEFTGIVGATKVETVGEGTLVRMSVATEYAYTINGEHYIDTTWHNVSAFDNTPEKNLTSIRKGYVVNIKGRIRRYKMTDNYGNDKIECEIVARKVNILSTDRLPLIPEKEPTEDK